jgi:hypothetical protein
MALPTSFYSQTIYDSTLVQGKPTSTTWEVPVATLTAANLVAKTALIAALKAAVAALVLGNIHQDAIIQNRPIISDLPAATNAAQRENKLLCRYHSGTSLKKFTVSIGTFDLTQLPLHNEFLDLTAGNGLSLKTAFEAIVVNPDDGSDPVILDSAQFVGRNT